MKWSSSILKIWILPPKSYKALLCVVSLAWFAGLQSSEPVLMPLTKNTLSNCTIFWFQDLTFWIVEIWTYMGAWAISSPGKGLCAFPLRTSQSSCWLVSPACPNPSSVAAGPCDVHSAAALRCVCTKCNTNIVLGISEVYSIPPAVTRRWEQANLSSFIVKLVSFFFSFEGANFPYEYGTGELFIIVTCIEELIFEY